MRKRKKVIVKRNERKNWLPIIFIFITLFVTGFFLRYQQEIRLRAQTTLSPASAEFPSKVFSPYVDVMAFPTFDFAGTISSTGQKYYTLGFIQNSGTCTPGWGGITPLSQNFLYEQINAIRSAGGDVIVSFGGAAGVELGQSCTTPETLQAAYQQVITQYKVKWIDLDIEGAASGEPTSVDRRNKAITGLQQANPGLKVSYTLPVLPSGLTQDGLNVLSNAKTNGVSISVVNIMAMDYGASAAPNPNGQMGKYALDAASSVRSQLQTLGITTNIGITPMIGVNDVATEIFMLTDAQQVVTSAASASDITLLGMWSANRDNGTCANGGAASPKCSGVAQADFDFIKTFQKFTSGAPTTTVVPSYFCAGGANCVPTPSGVPSQASPMPTTPPMPQPTTPGTNPLPTTVNPIPTSAPIQPTAAPNPTPPGQNKNIVTILLQFIQLILQFFLSLFR